MSSTTEPSPWLSPSPILVAVQSGRVFNDSKDFVDAPLLVSRAECWRRWALLPQPPPSDALRKFVNDTFGPADSLLAPWTQQRRHHRVAPGRQGLLRQIYSSSC